MFIMSLRYNYYMIFIFIHNTTIYIVNVTKILNKIYTFSHYIWLLLLFNIFLINKVKFVAILNEKCILMIVFN